MLCGSAPDGFIVDSTRTRLRPRESAKPGTTAVARVAQTAQACSAEAGVEITLLVTATHPEIERDSVVLSVDSGRLEVRGRRLEGMRLGVVVGDEIASDVCLQVTRERERELCAVNVPRDLPADARRVQVLWAPAEGRIEEDMLLFDARGRKLALDKL